MSARIRTSTNYHDDYGIRHACVPVFADQLEGYGKSGIAHFPCGCRPVIHRFKCCYCEEVVGWCLGAADDEPLACDDCWNKYSDESPRREEEGLD